MKNVFMTKDEFEKKLSLVKNSTEEFAVLEEYLSSLKKEAEFLTNAQIVADQKLVEAKTLNLRLVIELEKVKKENAELNSILKSKD